METIVVHNVPADRLDFYRNLATGLGGNIVSVANEPDGEFTVVICVPKS